MDSTVSNFIDVFSKIELPEILKKVFESTSVLSIVLNEKEKILNINLSSNRIVNNRYLQSLKIELSKSFSYINDIILSVNYSLECTTKEKIDLIWDNIIAKVFIVSPLCSKILEESNYKLNDNNLLITVKNNSAFLLNKNKINKLIEDTFAMELNFYSNIIIKDVELSKNDKNDYNNLLIQREQELIETAITDTTIRNIEESNAPSNQNSPNKQSYDKYSSGNKKFTRLPALKINNDLSNQATENSAQLSDNLKEGNEILINGQIFEIDKIETKSGNFLIIFSVTDKKDSITIKFFCKPDAFKNEFEEILKKNSNVAVKGKVQFDDFSKEINIMAKEICAMPDLPERLDTSEEKRVELHLHTKMSSMDGINSAKELITQASKWGHKAIAITDHGVVQAFPEAMEVQKKLGIKIIYGVEAYLIDDLGAVVECPNNQTFEDEFVVFDIETTGFSKETDKIIEIGAIKLKNSKIIDSFSTFVNPKIPIPEKITELTNITDEMVMNQPEIHEILPSFLEFIGDSVLVAHNANFDMGFIRKNANDINKEVENTVLDTLELSRTLLTELHRHKLNIIAEHLEISLENHHRAVDDAKATAEIFLKFVEMLKEKNINYLSEVNLLASEAIDKKKLRPHHAIIFAKNYTGLRNLYELISKSHIEYFYRRPRIPKSELIKFREGLLVGTACEAGEFYKAILDKKPKEFIKQLAGFYDYFEIQPIDNNMFLVREEKVENIDKLIKINKKIVELGEYYNKPVVATCDVHFLDKEDAIYRKVIMHCEGFSDTETLPSLHFRTTDEMLEEFSYLGEKKAKEVVIDNTNKIADMIDNIKPIPDETFPPKIEGSDEEIKNISLEKAKSIYGDDLPKIVSDRLNRELDSIIKNGFSVMYIIAQKLVWKSLEDGYLVGSRGSVGSSFVATMSGITEVNPLQPHYICPNCKYYDFDSDTVKEFLGGSGCDMPDKNCPVCGESLKKDGHDIPFETFLGFDGDKEPDIDLNFSGEYQAKAHAYTEELFGTGFVFKAGTIGTIAEKTAFGFVKKYIDENEITVRRAEINRLRNGCTGIKRTTGQHPGGLMIVPNEHSIYEFCPIQRPANDMKSDVVTTHFDYHSISGRLLKLDILGHDVPTIIRYLQDTTGINPTTVDLGDKNVISLFTSPEILGVTKEDINCNTGSLGLPEFGTNFVRQMLLDTKPSTFAELVRISGLSHGTDVWFNNAYDLIKNNTATLKEVIPTRDDIMVYLINKGVEKKSSFKIMENVRKGKGLTEEEEKIMKENDVPNWYIESCKRIKYMFPKGHAVAYVMMTVRIGYFKIYYPYSFYGASFSVKSEDFDYEIMCQGHEKVKNEIKRINNLGKDITTKEKGSLTILELVSEMYARDLNFVPLDLYKSDATKFIVTDEGLLPPLCSIQGLGINAAMGIVAARKEGEFLTIEEFRLRTKTTKTVIEILKELEILKGIPETDQMSLF